MFSPPMRVFLGGVFAVISLGPDVLAQCPEGTPPPCSRPAPAISLAARRPNPRLDDRTWIVVPFTNVSQASEADWLSKASVNLLYLDMSRWNDIRVIDDERVADLIRAGGGGTSPTLSLQSAIAVARRAGAGRLVMGDVLQLGGSIQLVGKVYDVRGNRRLRTVRQDVAHRDSIMAGFSRLARAVLDVDAPAGSNLGQVGTTSVQAYQSYVLGLGYLNQWSLDSAHTYFTRALDLDSTFALAHYKLAVVIGWKSNLRSPQSVLHAGRAVALGTGLPTRERALLTGYAQMLSGHSADACSIFERMIRTDSSDVEGWYNLGECLFHDTVILPEPGDSSRFVFRTSWNDMIRAFRKVLELDPSYHLAFQHIYDAFVYSFRMGCRPTSNETVCPAQMTSYRAVPLRRNDTLVTVPAMSESALQNQLRESGQTHARRAHLLQARRYAEEWLTAGPNESRPLTAYFRILRRMGDLAAADSVRRLIPSPSPSGSEFIAFIEDGLELTIRQGRGDKTGALLDSLAASPDTTRAFRSWSAIIRSVMGQTAGLRPMYEEVMSTAPPWVTEYFVQMACGFAGAPAEGLFAAESVFVANVLTRVGQQRAAIAIAGSLVWTVPASRNGRWPVTDTASANPQVKLISFLATGDTARFRTVLAQFDSLSAERTEEPDMGYALLVAHAHLAIADSAGALNYLRHFRQISWARSTLTDQIVPGTLFGGMLWARTLLLLADLSAATGHREEAIEAYGLFIAMWKQGDPEVQPVVERARLALRGLQQ